MSMCMISPPKDEPALMQRAEAMAGKSLGQIAAQCELEVPQSLLRAKGWMGQLLEIALGATAKTRPEPDFHELGIELKSLPLNHLGEPSESTFVCTIALTHIGSEQWETSLVYKKLKRVLWIPLEGDKKIAIAHRRIGMPILWSPSEAQVNILKQDWTELTGMIGMGQLEDISARLGTYLQVRPKGADAKSLCWGINDAGEKSLTLPRGFYLRAGFTKQIMCQDNGVKSGN